MNQIITVVSGLPRSGTSMMMKMLQAGGMELLVDDIRTADEDNPKGYFEYEKVKRLHKDSSWIGDARGKTLKVISLQLFQLPSRYQYRVVFMQRTLEEIIQSQNAMLKRLGRKAAAEDQETRILFAKHLAKVTSWLAQKKKTYAHAEFHSMACLPIQKEKWIASQAFSTTNLITARCCR